VRAQDEGFRLCNICRSRVTRAADLQWQKDGYDILRCPCCGILFRADLPSPGDLHEIYGPAYFVEEAGCTPGQGYSDYLGDEQNHRMNAAARLKLLERYQPAGRLLDVGCAAGFFLDEARQRGWDAEGVELAVHMAAYARDSLGLSVRAAPFGEAQLEPGAYDAITMWDYLEHSIDPGADLQRASELLRPGGVLAVSTGDAASIAARVFRSRWHLLTPRHHNFFFTKASLQKAFRGAGFEVVLTKYRSSLYSLHYMVHKLQTLTDWRLVSALARIAGRTRLAGPSIPINLFDIVTVVGRRV
jgi:SAM-dependent methyltransferase